MELSLSVASSAVGAISSSPSSTTLSIAVHRVAWRIFSNSTVVHTNGSREQNHAHFRGDFSSLYQDDIVGIVCRSACLFSLYRLNLLTFAFECKHIMYWTAHIG